MRGGRGGATQDHLEDTVGPGEITEVGVVTKEVIGLIPGLRLVTPITLIGLPIVTGHLIEIGGGTHNQKAVQDHIHREGSHQNVRREGGIIPTVLVQRGGGVVRNVKRTRSTKSPSVSPSSLLLHIKKVVLIKVKERRRRWRKRKSSLMEVILLRRRDNQVLQHQNRTINVY